MYPLASHYAPSDDSRAGLEAKAGDQIESEIKVITYLIQRLMRASELYTKELEKRYKVSLPQLNCLLALAENGPIPPSRIARRILVNSSTVTGIIDRLEKKGLVERLRESADRRVITITLTEAGRDFVRQAPPPMNDRMANRLRGLSPEARQGIVRGLIRLCELLDMEVPEGP
jgi:DNA-binding MarR family transcriptional regulator